MKRILFAATALVAASVPALAQYYEQWPRQPRGGYYYEPRPQPHWGQPRGHWGGGGYHYERPVVLGNICVTSRGSCRTRPRPDQSPCSCNIPGFGPKRGAISSGW